MSRAAVIPGNADISIYEIMERCSLNESDELSLKEYVESKGMILFQRRFQERRQIDLECSCL
jgi:N-acetylneuraminate synthase